VLEAVAEAGGGEATRVCVEDAVTRVMVARVHLSVGDLILKDGELVGSYAIEVPLKRSKDETGRLSLQLEDSFINYMKRGGTLQGVGRSDKVTNGERGIVCEVIPSQDDPLRGELRLHIDTGNRVMHFKTRYEVRGSLPPGVSGVAASR